MIGNCFISIEYYNYGGDKQWQVETNPVKQQNLLALMYKLALEEEIPDVKLISREGIQIPQLINLIKLGGNNNKMAPISNIDNPVPSIYIFRYYHSNISHMT